MCRVGACQRVCVGGAQAGCETGLRPLGELRVDVSLVAPGKVTLLQMTFYRRRVYVRDARDSRDGTRYGLRHGCPVLMSCEMTFLI